MPKLAVQLVRRAITGELAVRISLSSDRRKGLDSQVYVDPDASDLEYLVGQAAEKVACHQCVHYQDVHNPQQIATVAVKMVRKLKASGEKTNQKLEARA